MWKLQSDYVAPVALATLCTTLARLPSPTQSAICSDIVSWLFLPTWFRLFSSSDGERGLKSPSFSTATSQSAASSLLWIIALNFAMFALYRAERGLMEILPLLVPVLFIAQTRLRSEFYTFRPSSDGFFWPFVDTIWGTSLISILTILALEPQSFRTYTISILPVAALLVFYLGALPRASTSSRSVPHIDFEGNINALAWRIVAILGWALIIRTLVIGSGKWLIVSTLFIGLVKSFSWFCIYQSTRHTSWSIAPIIETFSLLSTRDPFLQPSGTRALLHLIASGLALAQIIHLLPGTKTSRSRFWLFSLVPIIFYLLNIFATSIAQSTVTKFSIYHGPSITSIVHTAQAKFNDLQRNQSENYIAACDEYRRRYGIDPPTGFQAWYDFAIMNNSPIIDEFDTIHQAIAPFLQINGQRYTQIMDTVQNASETELWLCDLQSTDKKTTCKHSRRSFDRHVGNLFTEIFSNPPASAIELPDLNFFVNHLDEPRVVITPSTAGDDTPKMDGAFTFGQANLQHNSTWKAITKYCTPRQGKESEQSGSARFATNIAAEKDLCQHPEYSEQHGLFVSPASFRVIEGLVPVLTTGSLSTMGDILFPSPAYIEEEFQYNDRGDMEWDEKRNNLYWAGSTSGGYAENDRWKHFHRQRFVALGKNLEGQQRDQFFDVQERSGLMGKFKTYLLNRRLFDVFFTRILHSTAEARRAQEQFFDPSSWADPNEALRSRLVFDLDGNGISGRYYKLLASKSAVLKQTVFQEWHDDRLVPWVHYIPITQGMKELSGLVLWLTETEEGRGVARTVAEQGRSWHAKALRKVDMSIYVYRLLLELARLEDPKREAI